MPCHRGQANDPVLTFSYPEALQDHNLTESKDITIKQELIDELEECARSFSEKDIQKMGHDVSSILDGTCQKLTEALESHESGELGDNAAKDNNLLVNDFRACFDKITEDLTTKPHSVLAIASWVRLIEMYLAYGHFNQPAPTHSLPPTLKTLFCLDATIRDYDIQKLCFVLVNLKKMDNTYFSKNSIRQLCWALTKTVFIQSGRKLKLAEHELFKISVKVLIYKSSQYGPTRHTEALSQVYLHCLSDFLLVPTSNIDPLSLLRVCNYSVHLYGLLRGREADAQLLFGHFTIRRSANGIDRMLVIVFDCQINTKNGAKVTGTKHLKFIIPQPYATYFVILRDRVMSDCGLTFDQVKEVRLFLKYNKKTLKFNQNQPMGVNSLGSNMFNSIIKDILNEPVYLHRLQSAGEDLNAPPRGAHTLRATGITLLGRCGVTNTAIQSISGHSSIESMSHYDGNNYEALEHMAQTLAQASTGPVNIPQFSTPVKKNSAVKELSFSPIKEKSPRLSPVSKRRKGQPKPRTEFVRFEASSIDEAIGEDQATLEIYGSDKFEGSEKVIENEKPAKIESQEVVVDEGSVTEDSEFVKFVTVSEMPESEKKEESLKKEEILKKEETDPKSESKLLLKAPVKADKEASSSSAQPIFNITINGSCNLSHVYSALKKLE
jgi:hypothetical protein